MPCYVRKVVRPSRASLNRLLPSAFNLSFSGQKLLAPGPALTLRAFISGVAHAETVVAGLAIVAGKLLALRARIKRAGFRVAMFFVQFVLPNDAHAHLRIRTV